VGVTNVPDLWVTSHKEVTELSFVTATKSIGVIDYTDRKKNKAAIAFCDVSHFSSGQGPAVFGAKGRSGGGNIPAHLGGVLFYRAVSSLPKVLEGGVYISEIVRSVCCSLRKQINEPHGFYGWRLADVLKASVITQNRPMKVT